MLFRLIRLAAELLYSSFAWSYDAVAWMVSIGQWSLWVETGLAALPEGQIVELGHGPGHALARRMRQARATVGVDRSRQMGKIARRRLQRAGLPINLVRAQAQHLPLPSLCVDGVLSTFPSEYILDPQTLTEIRRVLKPGGILVVIPIARIVGTTFVDRAAAWLAHKTGEDRLPAPSLTEVFAPLGMSIETEWVQLPRSRVLRLIARKSSEQAEGEVKGT